MKGQKYLKNYVLKYLNQFKMIEKRLVRFPNESDFIEMDIDMDDFNMTNEFNDEMFGWYKGIYISIKL